MVRSIEQLSFDGATGAVAFDALRDRATEGQLYSLSSFELIDGGADLALTQVRLVSCNRTEELRPIVWLGEALATPVDLKVQKEREEQQALTGWVTAAVVLVALLLATSFWAYRQGSEKKRREESTRLVTKAIAGLQQLDHACVLISARDFLALGRLVSHEKLRDLGKLHYFDTPKSLNDRLVVFFSQCASSHAHERFGTNAHWPDARSERSHAGRSRIDCRSLVAAADPPWLISRIFCRTQPVDSTKRARPVWSAV